MHSFKWIEERPTSDAAAVQQRRRRLGHVRGLLRTHVADGVAGSESAWADEGPVECRVAAPWGIVRHGGLCRQPPFLSSCRGVVVVHFRLGKSLALPSGHNHTTAV